VLRHLLVNDPPGLYDVQYFQLSNGLDVVLKKRTQADNVAVRLDVNVGSRNFPCDKRETAHFLEHLLFMGTSRHSEAELARMIQDPVQDQRVRFAVLTKPSSMSLPLLFVSPQPALLLSRFTFQASKLFHA
jgi:hypothetical protein